MPPIVDPYATFADPTLTNRIATEAGLGALIFYDVAVEKSVGTGRGYTTQALVRYTTVPVVALGPRGQAGATTRSFAPHDSPDFLSRSM